MDYADFEHLKAVVCFTLLLAEKLVLSFSVWCQLELCDLMGARCLLKHYTLQN